MECIRRWCLLGGNEVVGIYPPKTGRSRSGTSRLYAELIIVEHNAVTENAYAEQGVNGFIASLVDIVTLEELFEIIPKSLHYSSKSLGYLTNVNGLRTRQLLIS